MTVTGIGIADDVGVNENDPTFPILQWPNYSYARNQYAYMRARAADLPAGVEWWIDAHDRSGHIWNGGDGTAAAFAKPGYYYVGEFTLFRNDGIYGHPVWTPLSTLNGSVEPDGVQSGELGQAFLVTDDAVHVAGIWLNTDGDMAWRNVGYMTGSDANLINASAPTNGGRLAFVPDRWINQYYLSEEVGGSTGPYLLGPGAGINGRGGFRFLGYDAGEPQGSMMTQVVPGFLYGACTVFVVGECGSTDGPNHQEWFRGGLVATGRAFGDPITIVQQGCGSGHQAVATVSDVGDHVPHVLTFVADPTSVSLTDRLVRYVDDGTKEGDNTNDAPVPCDTDQIVVGFGYLNGTLGEIIAYSRVLTDDERNAVIASLMTKWGL